MRANYLTKLPFPIAAAARLVRNAVSGRNREAHDDQMPNVLGSAALSAVFQSEKALLALTDLLFGVGGITVARRA